MRVHAIRDEASAVVVEADSPGIGRAVGEVFEDEACRMNAIDAAIAVNPFVRRRARPADPEGPADPAAYLRLNCGGARPELDIARRAR